MRPPRSAAGSSASSPRASRASRSRPPSKASGAGRPGRTRLHARGALARAHNLQGRPLGPAPALRNDAQHARDRLHDAAPHDDVGVRDLLDGPRRLGRARPYGRRPVLDDHRRHEGLRGLGQGRRPLKKRTHVRQARLHLEPFPHGLLHEAPRAHARQRDQRPHHLPEGRGQVDGS